jgi:hypothetical protein
LIFKDIADVILSCFNANCVVKLVFNKYKLKSIVKSFVEEIFNGNEVVNFFVFLIILYLMPLFFIYIIIYINY